MTADAYKHDRRSRRSLFLSNTEWRECREVVKGYVGMGYGLQVVPPLEHASDEGRGYVVYSIANLVHEMVRRGHEVIFLRKRGAATDVEQVLTEVASRGVKVEVREC